MSPLGGCSLGVRLAAVALAGAAALSCGSRSPYWDEAVDTSQAAHGLNNGVVIVDDANHQVVALTSLADHSLVAHRLPLGHHFASAAPTPDGLSLLMLSSGDWPLLHTTDDPPSLTMLTIDDNQQASVKRYGMSEPLGTLAVDPEGQYAVAYQGKASNPSFATNPNELVLFDLKADPGPTNPVTRTLQSFGSSPQRITFSPTLDLPANAAASGVPSHQRRLLVVETTTGVVLVDLSHAFDTKPGPHGTKVPNVTPDITVPLSSGTGVASVTPAGVAIDPNVEDGWIAVRTIEDHNVYTMQLIPAPPVTPAPTTPQNDFTPSLSFADVGGTPSDIAWVTTSAGLRVAALVPSATQAVLVKPDDSATTTVALATPYSNLSLVTASAASGTTTPPMGSSQPDVAMLWLGGGQGGPVNGGGVALWTLGDAVNTPYRSVDVLGISDSIDSVRDVPGSGHANLKVLTTPNGSTHALYVLDLATRTSSPIDTTGTPTVSFAPDGSRFWVYSPGGTDLAAVDTATLTPIPLTTTAPITSAFEVMATGGTARTLIAVDAEGTFGATVFDALKPQTASSTRDVALLLGGNQ